MSKSMLCKNCQNFDIQAIISNPRTPLRWSHDEVNFAARQGCAFCSQLIAHVRDALVTAKEHNEANVPLWINLSIQGPEQGAWRRSWTRPPTPGIPSFIVSLEPQYWPLLFKRHIWPIEVDHELCVIADADSPAARSGDVAGRWFHEVPSAPFFDTLCRWLAGCLSHSECNETAPGGPLQELPSTPLPTRCIEMGDQGEPVRLREPGLLERGTYVTLSHRWSEETKLSQTTKDNLPGRLAGEGLHNLPRIFRDAMLVASKLGVRYLWIDSICIVQGSQGDWSTEALNMSQYYRNSLFTIVAAVSAPADGLFRTSVPGRLVRLPYRDREFGDARGQFYVYERAVPLAVAYSNVHGGELHSRGWVFQEWLLSRRLINFSDQGVIFECQAAPPLNDNFEPINVVKMRRLVPGLPLPQRLGGSHDAARNHWYQLMESYSGKRLTDVHKDRIVAVAGIAREYHQVLSRQPVADLGYVAGLWLGDIHYGLLWHVDGCEPRPRLGRVAGIPSWAWSSVLARVKWLPRLQGSRTASSIKAPEIPPAATDNRFDSTSTTLRVRGKLLPVVVRQHLALEEHRDAVLGVTDVSPRTVTAAVRAVCSCSSPSLAGGWGVFEADCIDKRMAGNEGISVYAFHVCTRRSSWFKNTAKLGSLRLSHDMYDVVYLDLIGPGRYSRVGMGCLFEMDLLAEFKPVAEAEFEME